MTAALCICAGILAGGCQRHEEEGTPSVRIGIGLYRGDEDRKSVV